jgi:hypothetical protein
MPSFCRHNRLIQNCPICAREQDIELRPVVSSSAPKGTLPRTGGGGSGASRSPSAARPRAARAGAGLTVRRLERGADDGYRSGLVPGLKSSADAERLATELVFAAARLGQLAADPPGLYADAANRGIALEERLWLAFLIAYLCPLDGERPFATIGQVRTSWASGAVPAVDGLELGPRSSHEAGRGARTLDAYRAWAERAGSQEAAFIGDPAWPAERRFARAFERLVLPGLQRGARFDLLTTLGRLGVLELSAGALFLGGADEVTLAAKRLLGIGDPLLLDRRAAALADACELPLEALDVGFYNWERGSRAALGMQPSLEPDPEAVEIALAALGL